MPLQYNKFESEFGFRSPGFEVDNQGNVTLRSITYSIIEEEGPAAADFDITQNIAGTAFNVGGVVGDNPTITLEKGTTYTFNITLSNLTWNIKTGDGSSPFNDGLSMVVNGVTYSGPDAQGRTSGVFTFDVPVDAPDNLRFSDSDGLPFGLITCTEPVITGNASFRTLTVAGNLNALGTDADIRLQPTGLGTVQISAGSGSITGLNINANTLSAASTVTLQPVDQNVTIIPTGSGVLTINSGATGTINNVDIGTSVPGSGTFDNLNATSGALNGVTIGATTPATGSFTTVSATGTPSNVNDLTNKGYVDSNSIAFAIALGS